MTDFVWLRLAILIASARLVKGRTITTSPLAWDTDPVFSEKSVAADLDMEPAPDVHEKHLSTSSCEEMVIAPQNS
jgi:hypothetical protein